MNYELRVKINEKWNSLDLGEERPAMIYQMNNLAELKDRQASFSQAIKIPKTRNNIVALGYVNLVDVLSDVAYRLHPCELFARGVKISPVGAVLTILNVDFPKEGYINCQIISGASDLFSSLEQKEGKTIGGDAWRVPWTVGQIVKDTNNNPLISWFNTVYQNKVSNFVPYPAVDPIDSIEIRETKYFTPSINFDETVRRIFEEEDYILDPSSTNVGNPNVYISCSDLKDLKSTEDNVYNLRAAFGYGSSVLCPAADETSNVVPASTTSDTHQSAISGSGTITGYAIFKPFRSGGLRVTVDIDVTGNLPINPASLRILQWSIYDGEKKLTAGDVDARPNAPFHIDEDVYIENADAEVRIYITSIHTPAVVPTSFTTLVRVSQLRQNAEIPELGDTIDLLECTSFKSRKDIVKAYLQYYGASIEISKAPVYSTAGALLKKGSVRIFNFEKLYQSVSSRVDWSSKLVESNQMGFQQGDYAQKNIIKLKDNSEELVSADEALFIIQDTSLKGIKELFELGFSTGRSLTYNVDLNIVIPTIVVATYSEDKTEFIGSPTQIYEHYLFQEMIIKDGIDYLSNELQIKLAKINPLQSIVDNNYKSLQKILNNAKILTLKFNLSIIDIAKLDFYTPVYLEQFGAYFYVNKVSNYVVGNTTTVELIKL